MQAAVYARHLVTDAMVGGRLRHPLTLATVRPRGLAVWRRRARERCGPPGARRARRIRGEATVFTASLQVSKHVAGGL